MKKLITYLNSPYPLDLDWKSILKRSFWFGFFIAALLFTFKPFGFHQIPNPQAFWFALGFGVITSLAIVVNSGIIPRLLPNIFDEDQWKLYKEFIYILITILFIGFANTLFLYFTELSGGRFWNMLLYIELSTFTVGMLPVALFLVLDQNRLLKQNMLTANVMSGHLKPTGLKSEDMFSLVDENGKEHVQVELNQLVYAKSDGNYLDVFFRNDDQQLQRLTIRQRLKSLIDELPNEKFYNCHKSFIVNLDHVERISGNARNYVLLLKVDELEIPVSRSKGSELQELLG